MIQDDDFPPLAGDAPQPGSAILLAGPARQHRISFVGMAVTLLSLSAGAFPQEDVLPGSVSAPPDIIVELDSKATDAQSATSPNLDDASEAKDVRDPLPQQRGAVTDWLEGNRERARNQFMAWVSKDPRRSTGNASPPLHGPTLFPATLPSTLEEIRQFWLSQREEEPNGFLYQYNFGDAPGPRVWRRDGRHWTETYPDGRVTRFNSLGPVEVEGRRGTLLQRDEGFFIFVSDLDEVDPKVYFIQGKDISEGKWSYLGSMEEVE